MQDQKTKKVVKLTVVIPQESYGNMKLKAQTADISINKFLNRAGSIVTTEQIVNFPLMNNVGAATYENIDLTKK